MYLYSKHHIVLLKYVFLFIKINQSNFLKYQRWPSFPLSINHYRFNDSAIIIQGLDDPDPLSLPFLPRLSLWASSSLCVLLPQWKQNAGTEATNGPIQRPVICGEQYLCRRWPRSVAEVRNLGNPSSVLTWLLGPQMP